MKGIRREAKKEESIEKWVIIEMGHIRVCVCVYTRAEIKLMPLWLSRILLVSTKSR